MEELIKKITSEAGISEEQAEKAVKATLAYVEAQKGDSFTEKLSAFGEEAKEKFGFFAGEAKEKLEDLKEGASETFDKVKGFASKTFDSLKDRFGGKDDEDEKKDNQSEKNS